MNDPHRPDGPKIARLSDPQMVTTILDGTYLGRGARPVLMVLGGAGRMTHAEMEAARPLFVDIAHLCERIGAAVVDGGTDGGVMRLTGESRRSTDGSYPLIGVAPEEKIALPGSPHTNRVEIEPNHTHLIVVPGSRWGDESAWISRIALSISGARSTVAIVVGGGAISLEDVREAVNAGIRVIAVADSGRTASRLASASEGDTKHMLPQAIIETGLVTGKKGIEDPASATDAIRALLE